MVVAEAIKLEQDESATATAEPGVGAAMAERVVSGVRNYPSPAFMIRWKGAGERAATAAMVPVAVVEAVEPAVLAWTAAVVAEVVVAAGEVWEGKEASAAELPLASCCITSTRQPLRATRSLRVTAVEAATEAPVAPGVKERLAVLAPPTFAQSSVVRPVAAAMAAKAAVVVVAGLAAREVAVAVGRPLES